MISKKAINILSQLVVLHSRSLPMYLSYTRPWTRPGSEGKLDVLRHIINDHQYAVDKLVHVLEDTDATITRGDFPMEYTDLHDLSLSYLLGVLIDSQKNFVSELEFFVEQLDSETIAKEITQECLGMAKGHLMNLEETAAESAVLN